MIASMKSLRYLSLPVLLLAFGCQTSPKPSPDLLDIRRFQPAAERGEILAQYNLGAAYASQWRPVEANQWLRKAAEQGLPEAEYSLAVNSFRGDGMPQDATEAYAWFDVAAAQGHLLAVNARESLASRMTRVEVEAGDRRAAAIIAKIPPQNLRYRAALGQSAKQDGQASITAENSNRATIKPANTAAPTIPSALAVKSTAPAKTSQPLHYGSSDTKGAIKQTELTGDTARP